MVRYARRDRSHKGSFRKATPRSSAIHLIPSRGKHRPQVAQLADEAVSLLDEQAQGQAHVTDEMRREAIEFKTEASSYVSNRQAAEAQAQADNDEMRRKYASKKEEHKDC